MINNWFGVVNLTGNLTEFYHKNNNNYHYETSA